MVGVVDVEVIGPQSAQALLDLPKNVPPRQAAIVDAIADRLHDLRAQDQALAASAENGAQQFLGRRPVDPGRGAGAIEAGLVAVRVGRVDQVDAEIQGAADQPVDIAFAGRDAECRRAE